MRILAIDHGTARAGIAVCDPTETLVRPLGVVEPPEPAAVAEAVRSNDAELVVVGVPVSLDGGEGAQAAVAREFRDSLAEVLDVPVETYDERFTTRLAEGSRREGAAAHPDSLAAAHLLESFLASRRSSGARTGADDG
jgi:putative Holliday junction resolvase